MPEEEFHIKVVRGNGTDAQRAAEREFAVLLESLRIHNVQVQQVNYSVTATYRIDGIVTGEPEALARVKREGGLT